MPGSGPLFSRRDTSMCDHLRAHLGRNTVNVKLEPVDTDADLQTFGTRPRPTEKQQAAERRFQEVIRLGGLTDGVKRRKTSPPSCHACSTTLHRPWACLTCSFVGCTALPASSSKAKDCFRAHWQSSGGRCGFSVDASTGAIFCSACNDTTYPDTFEELFCLARARVEESNDHSREGLKGRVRGPWNGWEPGGREEAVRGEMVPASCRGLRPLLNLSQTCFLSAILQALIHNPLLKAYFLSEKHNRHICTNGSKGLAVGRPNLGQANGADGAGANGNGSGNGDRNGTGSDHSGSGNGGGSAGNGGLFGGGAGGVGGMNVAATTGTSFIGGENERDKGCMCCEMDRAFEEFHNEDKSPFGPVTMLYAMWHASAELEGYGQQDAHSFFLAALDQIHAHARGQMSSCNCIAHQTFAGSLLSTVTCSACQTLSTTIDPILDIQLDFPPDAAAPLESQGEVLTLAGLLRRFCAEENIGEVGRGWDCAGCGGGKGVTATRQLAIQKLPPVLSFQLKRFAHNATSTKVEASVRFPSSLDMRPYVESANSPATRRAIPDSLYTHELFAVVTHEGKLDNGHYWADVKCGEEWWHCDDDKVTPTTLSAVLAQKAYMLFYAKRSLAYAQTTPPRSQVSPAPGRSLAHSKSGKSLPSQGGPWATSGKGVGGKGAGGKGMLAGKSGHPIKGMAE